MLAASPRRASLAHQHQPQLTQSHSGELSNLPRLQPTLERWRSQMPTVALNQSPLCQSSIVVSVNEAGCTANCQADCSLQLTDDPCVTMVCSNYIHRPASKYKEHVTSECKAWLWKNTSTLNKCLSTYACRLYSSCKSAHKLICIDVSLLLPPFTG